MKKFCYYLFTIIIFLIVFSSCCVHQSGNNSGLPKFMVWDKEKSFGGNLSDEEIEAFYTKLKDHKIDAVFLAARNDTYKKIAPIAKKIGIEIHAWRWTMIRPDKEFMETHKDWYAVNKNNESCVDNPPYVDYYRWLCPNEPKVIEYLVNDYLELAKIDGIAGIHLDYIRYCDIFLPTILQRKYNLVQDHEMPEFDYCYCHRCREGYKKEFGYDPIDLQDSASQEQWKEWRLKAVVNVANTIAEEVKVQTGKLVTAAVFPTPKMSVDMVRQDWGKFELDAVFPMLYNGFYNKEVEWIGQCVKEGITSMEYKKDLYAGIMIRHIQEPDQFKIVIKSVLDNGAKGVVFFSARNLTDEHLKIIKEYN